MKIELGMYVRTKRGFITKVTGLDTDRKKIQYDIHNRFELFESEVINASYNIKDLIQGKDYVNGCLVFEDFYGDLRIKTKRGIKRIKDIDIIDIVTKEQFKQMSYKVGE